MIKKVFKIKKCDSTTLLKDYTNTSKKKFAVHEIIKTTNSNGPAGLIQVQTLSKILQQVIRVWYHNRIVQVFGVARGKHPIEIEYNDPTRGSVLGHWSLRGGRSPGKACSLNGCLYDAVAAQTGENAAQLRRRTARRIRRDVELLVRKSYDVLSQSMVGGARYSGSSARDAQRIIDNSQNGSGHPDGRSGHPRGHASYPSGRRAEDSIEGYSMSRWRSGFFSREEQDLVCHFTLITSRAQDLMAQLNGGSYKADDKIPRSSLDYSPLPPAAIWDGGRQDGPPQEFRTVCLVGKHFLNQQNDPHADIFILTFYPII